MDSHGAGAAPIDLGTMLIRGSIGMARGFGLVSEDLPSHLAARSLAGVAPLFDRGRGSLTIVRILILEGV